jgi:hypothetical protein
MEAGLFIHRRHYFAIPHSVSQSSLARHFAAPREGSWLGEEGRQNERS